jgi:pimeloyl-[acyl-carrier protein] methyl ester esterase
MIYYKDKTREEYKKILFIHGWGFTNKIWINFASKLFKPENCIFLNMYSYIESCEGNLQKAAKKVLDDHEDIDLIFSWSLGCYLAKEIEVLVNLNTIKMIYISYSPRFIKSKKWSFGFEENQILKLKQDLLNNKKKAIKNFYLLILGDFKRKKIFYKEIFLYIDLVMKVNLKTLNIGLDIIKNSNYDQFCKDKAANHLYIYGDRDKIVSSDIKNFIKILEPNSVIKVLPNSSHIPFLTNSDDFLGVIKEFI